MKTITKIRGSLRLAFGALCLIETALVQAGQPIVPVAVTDQLPPGIGPNTGFGIFQATGLSETGQVAFWATLIGVGINSTNDTAIFLGAPGALQLVAREGSVAPGSDNKVYTDFFVGGNGTNLNASGQVCFSNTVDSAMRFYTGLPGAISLLAQPGDIIPGAPAPISSVSSAGQSGFSPVIPFTDAGHAPFDARFEGSNDDSIALGAPGSLTLAAEPGMQAPGFPPGVTFSSLSLSDVWLQSEDRLLFSSSLASSTEDLGTGIFTGLPGSLALLQHSGDQAVGTDPGVFYDIGDGHALSASGTVAFSTFLTGLGVRETNRNALWVGVPGALQLVARGGMQAPGVEPGVTYGLDPNFGFAGLFNPLVINSSGQIAFAQYLSTGEQGIWAGPPDNLRLVARQGQTAPGLAPGETLGLFFGPLYIDDAGRVAFSSIIGTRALYQDIAIFVSNPDGELIYVTRYGDSVDVGDGRILTFSFYLQPLGFNSAGQLLIDAVILSDGSDGIFIAETAASVLTSPTTASGAIGIPFSYQITATNNPTSFSASGLPPGLSLKATTGLISGSPTSTGTFAVTVNATNEQGQGPAATLTITVTAMPPPTPTPSPSPSPSPSASPSPSPSVSPSPSPSASPTPTPFFPVQLANISTRLSVGTNDNVLIGGFIVAGTQSKEVIVRAIGPSLPLGGVLSDPVLELHDSTGATIATNDNWQESANKQAIIDAGFAPSNDNESAILMTLAPGPYTAIVQGVNGTTGVALVEIYDLDRTVDAKLANISTRGFVQTSDNVMIGGIIILGDTDTDVLVRAIGPALTAFGVTGALEDTTLELHDKDGAIIASNDDWKETQQTAIEATGLAPSDERESAILMTLAPDSYTAIVRGEDDTTGVALVEVYNITP